MRDIHGKFVKGHKLGNRFKKGNLPWCTGKKGLYCNIRKSESRSSSKYKEWSKKVKERDGNKCIRCFSDKRIASHHINPWKEHLELRFDIDNGMTLCASCHGKEEGFQKGHKLIFTEEIRKKISEAAKKRKISEKQKELLRKARIGKPGPNRGRKFSEEHKKKLSEAKKGKVGVRMGTKNKNPSPLKGIKLSDDHRKKLSEAAKRRCRIHQQMI